MHSLNIVGREIRVGGGAQCLRTSRCIPSKSHLGGVSQFDTRNGGSSSQLEVIPALQEVSHLQLEV